MLDPFRFYAEPQRREALLSLARHFGLTMDEMQRAAQAMMPAFVAAMQQAAGDPRALASIFETTAEAARRGIAGDPRAVLGRDAQRVGEDAIRAMFGSMDVARAMSDQMARFASVSPQVVTAMMPTMAALVSGSLPQLFATSPWGRMMAGMAGGAGAPVTSQTAQQASGGWADAFERATAAATGPAQPSPTLQARPPQQPQPEPQPANFWEALARFYAAMGRAAAGRTENEAPAAPPSPRKDSAPPQAPAPAAPPPQGPAATLPPAGPVAGAPEAPPVSDWGRIVEDMFKVGEETARAQIDAYRRMLERLRESQR